MLGVVVEARHSQATPAFALYADGRARYLDSDCLVAWELPELPFARAWLLRLESEIDTSTPGRASQHIEPGEVRITLLTPSGPRVPKTIDRGFVARQPVAGAGVRVVITEAGEKFLLSHGRVF